MFKNKKITSILLVFVCVLFLSACGDSNSDSSAIPSIGESVTLSQQTLCGTSKENLDKALSFISEKNSSGLDGMIADGECFEIPKDTKVNVIGYKGATLEIETPSGQSGYTVVEAVK